MWSYVQQIKSRTLLNMEFNVGPVFTCSKDAAPGAAIPSLCCSHMQARLNPPNQARSAYTTVLLQAKPLFFSLGLLKYLLSSLLAWDSGL